MSLNQITVPLQPRKASGCLDVAVRFYAKHMKAILPLWVSVMLPAAVLTYLLTWRLEQDFRLTVVVLYGASWLIGLLTVAGTARGLFGQPFLPEQVQANRNSVFGITMMTVNVACGVVLAMIVLDVISDLLGADFLSGELQLIWYVLSLLFLSVRLAIVMGRQSVVTPGFAKALFSSGLRRLLVAFGPLLVLFPLGVVPVIIGLLLSVLSVFVMIRYSFAPESIFLASFDAELHGRGIKDLLKKEGGELFLRGSLILGFGGILSLVVFFTLDQVLEILLAFPVLVGRMRSVLDTDEFFSFENVVLIFEFLFSDPRCLTVLTASVLLVYPIVRIAWFFCYIDLRVRRDCWDIELAFQQEARRLEGIA